jgi:selenocysteine-specific elongation factor
MPYVIGTAGHIDHGKTSLVKALTGIDTDRLKEEKERGISIDLGFAHLDLPDGTRIGIVDVPGHERFIRNMLAGAHGIDMALFAVAADDGVMPQTQEHFDIVRLLGIERGVFAITKSDKVAAARLAEVEEEIRLLATGTPFEASSAVPVSSVTNDNLDSLRAEIARTLSTIVKPAPAAYFRLPIDRVFTLQGHGLIVTGTALSGEVAIDDRLSGLPGGQTFRVRSVQVHGEAVDRASWGQRVALNLTGHERPMLARGSVLCDERLAVTTLRFDAFIETFLQTTTAHPLKNHQRVRLHLGTAERFGKVLLLDRQERIGARHSGYCQIILAGPLHALRGDRFIIRNETGTHTLGGGVVLHPASRVHRRGDRAVLDALNTFRDGSPGAVVERFVDSHGDFAASLDEISRFINQTADHTLPIVCAAAELHPIRLESQPVYTTARKWHRLKDELVDRLRAFHRAHPLAAGQDLEEMRDRLPWSMSAKVFRVCVGILEQERAVAREGSVLRLPGHVVSLNDDDQQLAARIIEMLRAAPLTPPDLKEIQRQVPNRTELVTVMRVLERGGTIVRLTNDLYFLADALAGLRQALERALSADDVVTPAFIRERFGTSRKYAIPLLEYLDREGITQRIGDIRKLKQPQSTARF